MSTNQNLSSPYVLLQEEEEDGDQFFISSSRDKVMTDFAESSTLSTSTSITKTTTQLEEKEEEDNEDNEENEENSGQDNKIKQTNCLVRWWKSNFSNRGSLLMAFLVMFIAEASRGIAITSLGDYVHYKNGADEIYKVSVSMFSVGRLLAAIILGVLVEKRGTKECLLISSLISIVGNLLYAFAIDFPVFIIPIARFIIGFGTGSLGVVRAYIALVTTVDERTKFVSLSGIVQFAGFSITPGLAAAFGASPNATLTTEDQLIEVNAFTLPGYSMACVNLVVLLCLFFVMGKDPKPVQKVKEITTTVNSNLTDDISGAVDRQDVLPMANPVEHQGLVAAAKKKLETQGFYLFLFLNIVIRGVLAVAETLSPTTHKLLNAGDDDADQDVAEYFLILGAFGCIVYALVDPIIKKFRIREVYFFCFGILAEIVGNMLFIPYLMSGQYLTFTAGNTAVWAIASPICQTLCISTFSKLMGSKPQGKAMGLLTAAGSLGRIIFPLLTSAFSDTVVFLLCIAFGCISIGCLLVFQKRVKEVNKLTA